MYSFVRIDLSEISKKILPFFIFVFRDEKISNRQKNLRNKFCFSVEDTENRKTKTKTKPEQNGTEAPTLFLFASKWDLDAKSHFEPFQQKIYVRTLKKNSTIQKIRYFSLRFRYISFHCVEPSITNFVCFTQAHKGNS